MKLKMFSLAVLVSIAFLCHGSMQSCSFRAPPGQPGIPGTPGSPGIPGTPGTLAGCSCSGMQSMSGTGMRRWKQCTWTYRHGIDRDNGKVHECEFVKLKTDSYLRVVYMGNIRITSCAQCCKRWYFTFNDAECKTPAPIDGALYQGTNINIHRPSNIEGYCGGIAAGKVRVRFNVGNCRGHKGGDAHTSWNQSNRIIIEEVEPPVV